MKDRWEELLAVLSKMLSLYQTILALSQQKHEILITAKSHELETVTKQEEILIVQAGKLEDLREKIVGEMMAEYGMKDGEVSLAELKKIAKPEIVAQLEKFGKDFADIMAKILPLNQQNTELIQQALRFVNYNINLLTQTVVGPTYAAKGQADKQTIQRTVFDAKV